MDLAQQLLAVLFVILLLLGVLFVARRRPLGICPRWLGGVSARRTIEVLERTALTPQHTLHVVRIAGAVLVLGASPSGVSVLRELNPDAFRGQL